METKLVNSAFAASEAIKQEGHCKPGTWLCGDGQTKGTIFAWLEGVWIASNLDSGKITQGIKRLAVVTLSEGADPDAGLNQVALGIDLEVTGGQWVVSADDIEELQTAYDDTIEVVWVQGD